MLAVVVAMFAGLMPFENSALHLPGWTVPLWWAIAVFFVGLAVTLAVLSQRAKRARYTQVGGPVLSWQAAEQMAANHMRAYGFSDARTTPPGSDGGIDVVSRWGVAQVKYFSKPVGRPEVQKLRGAAHGRDRVLFYALTGFNLNAVAFADEAGIALFQFDQRGMVWPINGLAKAYKKPEQARV